MEVRFAASTGRTVRSGQRVLNIRHLEHLTSDCNGLLLPNKARRRQASQSNHSMKVKREMYVTNDTFEPQY